MTAVAVIGAMDAVQGPDTILPTLDLSQSVPSVATIDLTDIDFADLMAIAVEPMPRSDTPADVDLGEFDLEQLLAVRTGPEDAPPPDITRVSLENLVRVDIVTEESHDPEFPLDLTGLDPEMLQDLEFGDKVQPRELSHRQYASADLASTLDKHAVNDIVLFDRMVQPATSATSEYVPPNSANIDTRTTGGTAMTTVFQGIGPEPATRLDPPGDPLDLAPLPLADVLETAQATAVIGSVLLNDIVVEGIPLAGTPANQAPVAMDDLFTGTIGETISGNVLANDHDPDGNTLVVSRDGLLATDQGGTVRLHTDGTFEYEPAGGFSGPDGFSYAIEDGFGGTSHATVTLEVANPGRVLNGGAGDDWLIGTPGDDKISGKSGNDLLMGGDGNDILDGGPGIDALLGGAGDDVFVIGPGSGGDLDAIGDFITGMDVMDLGGHGLAGMSNLSITADGLGGSLIALPTGDSIALALVDPASLSPDDFIF